MGLLLDLLHAYCAPFAYDYRLYYTHKCRSSSVLWNMMPSVYNLISLKTLFWYSVWCQKITTKRCTFSIYNFTTEPKQEWRTVHHPFIPDQNSPFI